MKILSILLLFLTSFFIRASRWLSIVQQKEYRLDRLILFIKTVEGKKELLRLIPKKKDFSKTGLKRPKITMRILLVAGLFFIQFSFLIIFLVMLLVVFFSPARLGIIAYFIVGLLLCLIFIPALVVIAILPTSVVSSIRIFIELVRAKAKVKKSNPKIIGITGSYGKTSTKMILAKVLEKKYSVFKTPKSYNNRFSVARSINKAFQNQEIMIIEYGAYKKGEIKTLASWFKPNLAVITGLAKQHLGLFGTIESVIRAKAELIKALDPGSIVVCNGNDKGVVKICKLGAGLISDLDLSADSKSGKNLKIIEANEENKDLFIIKAHLNKAGKLLFVFAGQQVNTNLMGMHYLEIIRMVILVAKEFGVSDRDIVDAISSFVPDDKFIFSYKLNSGSLVIDDGGTSNPKGFVAAINLASSIEVSKKILITSGIVDLGSESESIHENLAKKAVKVFATVLYVGESGKEQFLSVFGEKFFNGESADDQAKITNFLSNTSNREMILIEGRMPGWIKQYI
ncbi:hypothetical protein KKD03_04940 [Patescibacteria group bacterium]|nr:hypothetical protein [Patescibacteria group bacterium]